MPTSKILSSALFLLAFMLPQEASAEESHVADSAAAERFSQIDQDKNSYVTWEELSAARPNLSSTAFEMIDKDKSGTISVGEWTAFSTGHGGGSGMGSMMRSMRGMGDQARTQPQSGKMSIVMPPSASGTPPASSTSATGGKMPLVMPPQANVQ